MYSPTAISVFSNNCPYAFACYKKRKEEQEYEVECGDMAAVGIAFHAMMHQAAQADQRNIDKINAIEASSIVLAQKFKPELVFEAKEMVNRFINWWKIPAGFNFEHGVAFDKSWKKTEWDSPTRRLRLIFDTVGVAHIETEACDLLVAVGQDYKTGWGCTDDELNSIQMDAYISAMYYLFRDEVDALQIEIISTRHNQTYSKMYLLNNEEDVREIKKRISRLEFKMDAIDASNYQPIVGLGCILCSEKNTCKSFAEYSKDVHSEHPLKMESKEQAVAYYSVMKAAIKEYESYLRSIVDMHGPIKGNGQVLDYNETTSRKVKDTFALLEIFLKAYPDIKLDYNTEQILRSFMALIKPSATQFDAVVSGVAKQLGYKTKTAAKDELGEKHLVNEIALRFGLKTEKGE